MGCTIRTTRDKTKTGSLTSSLWVPAEFIFLIQSIGSHAERLWGSAETERPLFPNKQRGHFYNLDPAPMMRAALGPRYIGVRNYDARRRWRTDAHSSKHNSKFEADTAASSRKEYISRYISNIPERTAAVSVTADKALRGRTIEGGGGFIVNEPVQQNLQWAAKDKEDAKKKLDSWKSGIQEKEKRNSQKFLLTLEKQSLLDLISYGIKKGEDEPNGPFSRLRFLKKRMPPKVHYYSSDWYRLLLGVEGELGERARKAVLASYHGDISRPWSKSGRKSFATQKTKPPFCLTGRPLTLVDLMTGTYCHQVLLSTTIALRKSMKAAPPVIFNIKDYDSQQMFANTGVICEDPRPIEEDLESWQPVTSDTRKANDGMQMVRLANPKFFCYANAAFNLLNTSKHFRDFMRSLGPNGPPGPSRCPLSEAIKAVQLQTEGGGVSC